MECEQLVAGAEGEKALSESGVLLWSNRYKPHLSFFFFELYDLNHCITGPVSLSQGKLILWGPLWEWTSVGTISALQRGYVKAAIGVASPHQFPPGALSPSACPRNPECL